MKTHSVNSREIVAWLVFVFAALLFSVSIAFAQDTKKKSSSSKKDDAKIHIVIVKDENGKKTKIDTTVAEKDLASLKEKLKEENIDFDSGDGDIRIKMKGKHPGKDDEDVVMNFSHDDMNKEVEVQMRREMKHARKEIEKAKDELREIHIEINGNDDEDGNFTFDMRVPSPPDAPDAPSALFFRHDGGDNDFDRENNFDFHINPFMGDAIPDSLRDDEHLVLRGKKDEGKPEFEKEIIGENGEKYFVFKRNLSVDASLTKRKGEGLGVSKLKVYPNPSDGKISVSFRGVEKSDVDISVTDAAGKEVFTKSLKDFDGEYFEQIDVSKNGKGTYFLKVTSGDDNITKKILVE